ncbi:hypothetical protein [Streptomyces sp. NPDC052015]|uniref:hypothetical protein n=1 Tax=Streptomyces sp. NPDC052015 TaxID=3154755 RepID=UPI00342BF71D
MSNEQRNQQLPVPQQEQGPARHDRARGEIVKKGALAAIGGLCSGAARAIVTHMLGDSS